MKNKPYLNAVWAELYIVAIVLFVQYGLPKGGDNNILTPIAMLSLFVLSAAVMGYLFVSKPLQLYFDGHKKEAVTFFIKTMATFAVITALVFVALAVFFSVRR